MAIINRIKQFNKEKKSVMLSHFNVKGKIFGEGVEIFLIVNWF